APATRTAQDDDGLLPVDFRQALANLVHGYVKGSRDVGDGQLPRLANVKQSQWVALVPSGNELRGCDLRNAHVGLGNRVGTDLARCARECQQGALPVDWQIAAPETPMRNVSVRRRRIESSCSVTFPFENTVRRCTGLQNTNCEGRGAFTSGS